MLISADWVLPIDGPPIRDGAVRIRNSRVLEVGPRESFADSPGLHRAPFPGCAILPGLVNAHTHLSLTALAGLAPPSDFTSWLRTVVPMIQALDEDDMVASATLGAWQCLQAGATVVGDIAYGAEALASAADVGVAGVFFWEVLGVSDTELQRLLEDLEFPHSHSGLREGRTRVGISAHAPYTCGPDLLRAIAKFAHADGYPLAVHAAESFAETSLLRDGGGPLLPVADRLAEHFEPPRTSPIAYLAKLGVLDDALAVHCVHLAKGDAQLLRDRARGVVLCPRSNAYLRNGEAPLETLVANKLTIGVGTDSPASNSGIDLFAEARALRRLMPLLPPARVLRMMTLEGAAALGMEERFGSLTPGKQADITILRIPGGFPDPETALVERADNRCVVSVMAGGVWRIREGRPAFSTKAVETAVARAAAKAKAARPR